MSDVRKRLEFPVVALPGGGTCLRPVTTRRKRRGCFFGCYQGT